MTKEFITDYGVIKVSNAMFEDDNGTDLFEGIELKDENGNIIEVDGYRDIDDMTVDEVEQIIENN
ncbi:MAG: hypothetical protein ACFFKA_00180 [Candidatus Thorarchaeota archaeon]